jgi:hypothetical protein
MGGYTGIGNIDADPLFADSINSDFHLTWVNFPVPDSTRSPCIDAGDPESPFDPDSTTADMGAFYFDQTLMPINSLTIIVEDTDIILQWEAVPGVEVYHIYRSTTPYFNISGLNPIGNSVEPNYTDANALLENQYYYRVTYEY